MTTIKRHLLDDCERGITIHLWMFCNVIFQGLALWMLVLLEVLFCPKVYLPYPSGSFRSSISFFCLFLIAYCRTLLLSDLALEHDETISPGRAYRPSCSVLCLVLSSSPLRSLPAKRNIPIRFLRHILRDVPDALLLRLVSLRLLESR